MIRLRHLAAASAVALWLTVAAPPLSTPVLAQSIVFDPNNATGVCVGISGVSAGTPANLYCTAVGVRSVQLSDNRS